MTDLDPIARFATEFARAAKTERFDASRAALATVDAQGRPSVRFVLVKEWDERGFCLYTNTESRKARELLENPRAALVWHWESTGVQVRGEGGVARLSDAEADAYFASRPRGSQIAAWASTQSRPIASRAFLEARYAEEETRFHGTDVTRPPFWGGYRLTPDAMEFWESRDNRLHHRERCERTSSDTPWRWSVLAP